MSLFKTLSGVFQRGEEKSSQKVTKTDKPVKQARQAKPVFDPKVIDEARAKAQEILVEAKSQALKITRDAEQHSRKLQSEFSKRQSEINRLESKLAQDEAANETKRQNLNSLERELGQTKADIDKLKLQYKQKLQELAQLSKDQAQDILFDTLQKRLAGDLEKTVKSAQQKAQEEAKSKAKEILIDALKHGATDYVAEYTVSTVKLPNEESKGRIIGKEGRNIRAFEKITGVDIDLDETPGEVRLSSFDPIRREIARVALSRLLSDGRIQPTRIEEYVRKAKADLDKSVFEEGKKMSHSVGAYNLPREILTHLGRYKFLIVDGQNVMASTMEQVKIGVALAEEIGANVDTVRLGCLLHDIGRTIQDEEGNHVDLGVKFLKRFNMPKAVTDAVATHHDTDLISTPEAVIVYLAANISAARPGASYKAFNEIVKRLHKLESVAQSFDGVKESIVLQAGREVRVLVHPDKVADDKVHSLALDIKDKIREEMSVPSTVTVTVLRETRASEVAK